MAEGDGIRVILNSALPPVILSRLGEALCQDLVEGLARDAVLHWDQEAREKLRTTALAYVQSIQAPEISPGKAVIVLNGALANRLENGWAAYDLHDVLLGDNVPVIERGQKGAKGKYKKKKGDGFYRYIPFRHTGPTSSGAEGTPVGAPYSKTLGQDAADSLAKQVWKMAKKLTPSVEGKGFGARLPAGITPKLKEHHSDSIYAGMYRIAKEYDKTTQYTYRTFRTISTSSVGWKVDANPGIHLAPQVGDYVSSIAQAKLDKIVAEMTR